MVFSSISFLFYFLPLVLVLYYLARPAWRNFVFLLAGLFFYLWGAGEAVLILIFSCLANWLFGLWAAHTRLSPRRWLKALPILGSVATNLGVLGYFKYANFFVDQLNSLGTLAIPGFASLVIPKIMLPIGVSFFTFQSMSYVFDIARGSVPPLKNPVDFSMYISMFPQLVAGPIVRYQEIAPQLHRRTVTWEQFGVGSSRFILGLVKKVVFADSIALLADQIFAIPSGLSCGTAWLGILAFTIQAYYDFSGYSDMAIGLGHMFGFRFPENFNRPYLSTSITEFWRRWHMTLSRWFRDYLYIPMGGSRGSTARTYFNLFTVFILVGLWHGANWTFFIFGLVHGFFLALERITGLRADPSPQHMWWRRALNFLILLLSLVLFRSSSLSQAGHYYLSLLAVLPGTVPLTFEAFTVQSLILLALGTLIVFRPGRQPLGIVLENADSPLAAYSRLGLATLGLTLVVLMMVSRNFTPFIYFQF